MEIGFKIFPYVFLIIVATILVYSLVKLFRGLKPVVCHAGNPLPQELGINTNVEVSDDTIKLIEKVVTDVKDDKLRRALLKEIIEGKPAEEGKPRGLLKWLWDNSECDPFEKSFTERMNDDLTCGYSGDPRLDRACGF